MTWNYRIIRHHKPSVWFGLHEVYYEGDGRPRSYTENPIHFTCDEDEGPEGITKSLRMALTDAERLPVLDESEVDLIIADDPKHT